MLVGWLAFISVAQAEEESEWPRGHYPLPEEGNVIGDTYRVKVEDREDTLLDIARRHHHEYREPRLVPTRVGPA
nr:hypothetical protein [uncultured Halomonas sp.]